MKLQGNGRGREVLVTLNVERETGRIFRTDQLRQQFSVEQAPQSNPQLGSRYLIADIEAEQLLMSAGLGQVGPPPGGEMVIPARGDLHETGKPGSFRLDPASVQPGRPMTPGTRRIEDHITSRAKELDSQGRTMTRDELQGIVEGVENGGGTVGMTPQGEQPSQRPQRVLGPNSQAGLASHRSGIPFNGPIVPPTPPRQQPVESPEKAPGEPRKAPKRELPISGGGAPRGADLPKITENDGVVSATAKGFVSGFQGEMRSQQRSTPREAGVQDVPAVADEAPRKSGTEIVEERLQRFPELRGDDQRQSPAVGRHLDPSAEDGPDVDRGPSR